MMAAFPLVHVFGEGSGQHQTPIARGPLPAFDRDTTDPETGAPLPVSTAINGLIPPSWTHGYMRANLWAVTLRGLPFIAGGNTGAAKERVLTYLFDRYPQSWQARILKAYGERGYEQFWLSIPDSRINLGIGEYIDIAKQVRDAGLIPCHFLRSKNFDGHNPDPTYIYRWIDALAHQDLISEACHAWEASLFYSPDALRGTIDSDARRYPQIRWDVHLQQGYPHFGPDLGRDRTVESARTFWLPNIAVGVKRLLYQYDTTWSAGMMQAKGNDVSVRLIQGGDWALPETVDWVAFETIATAQFNNLRLDDGRLADEDVGDLRGRETLATPGPLPPLGFGGGARHADGRVL